MDSFQAVILGAVQGITEWLPISSEGMNSLILTQFFGASIAEAIVLSLWLHIGTLFAALLYLRKDVIVVLRERGSIFNFLVISTIVSVIVAAPLLLLSLENFAVSGKTAMVLIGALLIATGILQLVAKKNRVQAKETPDMLDSIIAGIVQGLAVLPGLSRSGLTVSVLLFRKHSPKESIRLSFLMSIPAVIIAGTWATMHGIQADAVPALAGLLTAFVLGLLTIAAMFKLSERVNFGWFCILIGLLSVAAGFV